MDPRNQTRRVWHAGCGHPGPFSGPHSAPLEERHGDQVRDIRRRYADRVRDDGTRSATRVRVGRARRPLVPVREVDAPDPDYEQKVNELIARGKRDEAVKYFMRTVGVPGPFILLMRFMPFWKDAVAAAHTLPYDAAVMHGFAVPEGRLREIRVPTVVLGGGSTTPTLRAATDATARTVPGATERVISKQNHAVKPAGLRPVLVESFRASTDTGSPNAVGRSA